ncbi:hypothetical protein [Roseisolibacter agri]|uniref:Tripartite ATP-independent periplasmic transporters, DctQ component n=1 Tax=Roseisolibacter agri TaxID=2014610 RepID=A0AA37V8L6_9BACT|nr:hypothetical protein [Roseisolibacter agri]GLC23563.1 hypothetical protein rosag_00760 [Roseisolibacter agri]
MLAAVLVPIAICGLYVVLVRLGNVRGPLTFANDSADALVRVARILTYAGLGAVASVIMRLPGTDLSGETKTRIVVFAGAGRPILAAIFAVVVYQILHHGIINVGTTATPQAFAYVQVAAFLCGFSERFATDILDRVPFGGRPEQTRGAPVGNGSLS